MFDAREQRIVDARVYQRDALEPGDRVDGPAVIIESETSTIVTSRFSAVRQNDGCLLLQRKNDGGET
jgi:N-methylhydantoinase A